MSAGSLDADELIVKAELKREVPEEEFSMEGLHSHLKTAMDLEGYRPLEPRKSVMASRVITYVPEPTEQEVSFSEWLQNKLPWKNDSSGDVDYIEHLRSTRDDSPFKVDLRFFPFEGDGEIEIRVRITITPAVVEKHEQVSRQKDYNKQNAVRKAKEFANTIAAEFGWQFSTEPHTPAGTLEPTIKDEVRQMLTEIEYGQKVIQFCDEGDEALKYGLDHSALASYIHGIEWCIIANVKENSDMDILEKEEGGSGFAYKLLLDLLEEHGDVHQTTLENLKKHQTDRRIMAHHKSGKLSSSHVYSVKNTLRNFIEESFARPEIRHT